MKLFMFHFGAPDREIKNDTGDNIHRVEVPLVAPDDSQYKVILLDAEDSFDVIIHYPDSGRDCVWSLAK